MTEPNKILIMHLTSGLAIGRINKFKFDELRYIHNGRKTNDKENRSWLGRLKQSCV
jgi:hypothetical protein